MFKKEGVPLVAIMPAGTETIVERLREKYSITTAEELYCVTLSQTDYLRQDLQVPDQTWASILKALESGLPIETRQQLQAASGFTRGKGVRLEPPPSGMLDELKEWTSKR
jgi:hypothetical protein